MGWFFIVVIGLGAVYAISLFNKLVRLRNTSESAWSDIDVQLKRRHDLVPNLVETVQGYTNHERETLAEVTHARRHAMEVRSPEQRAEAEGALSGALRGLLAVAEAYPDLRASENFRDLQQQLGDLENGIQKARRYYNAVVRDLNTLCEAFPSNLVASSFGFHQAPYFELDDVAERSAPRVRFDRM